MKRIPALVAAALVTAVMAIGMLAIGWNAWFASVRDTPAAPAGQPASAILDSGGAGDVGRLQRQVTEQQAQIQSLQQQLDQANQQVQQLQGVLGALQQRGIIRINSDGTIQLGSQAGGRSGR